MKIINFEFKAKVNDIKSLEQKLLVLKPIFRGEDHQVDIYFNVTKGRLKLRQGNIENALIYYERENIAGSKRSDVLLYQHQYDNSLKEILEKIHGIKVIVDKQRKIYFINNIKFHFDTVADLGTFIEVEAIDDKGETGIEKLKEQCLYFFNFFGLKRSDFMNYSYSDLLLEKKIL